MRIWRTTSGMWDMALAEALITKETPASRGVRSDSVTMHAISTSSSLSRSKPVISQSSQTRRSPGLFVTVTA